MPFATSFLNLATPVFGFALTVAPAPAVPLAVAPAALASDAALGDDAISGGDAVLGDDTIVDDDAGIDDDDQEAMRRRSALAAWHRPLGLTTWGAMTVTEVLGAIQYFDRYGLFAAAGATPCGRGEAIMGQEACTATPWPHLASAIGTTVLYSTTHTLALLMPGPGARGDGDGDYARNLRLHKVLRWVHVAGVAAQIILGPMIANADRVFGLDREHDYGTLQGLATVHMGIGLVTYAALTWAGLLML